MENNNALPKRSEVPSEHQWRLEDIYPAQANWEEDFKTLKGKLPEIAAYSGKLNESSNTLLTALKLAEKIYLLSDKIFVYARMRRDEDNTNTTYQSLTDRATALLTDVSSAVSYMTPEIISIPDDQLKGFYNNSSELAVYKQYFEDMRRQKDHVLTNEIEQILALSSEMAGAPGNIFGMFDNADIKFPVIKDQSGQEVELTKGRYIRMLESPDRRVRKDAFEALYSSYEKMRNSLGTMLVSNMKKNKFYATVRKYDSYLDQALDDDNVKSDVYDTLIETVHKNLHLLHRYVSIRKKYLKLTELHMYDLYVPIVQMPEKEIPYAEALDLVKKGMAPLGEAYIQDLETAFTSNWIDIYENKGKTGGAYSWGEYSTHPYVLLNYQKNIKDVFTLAHEMGHALHSYYTNKKQPYIYSSYKIFVAEVASTVNENLLMQYMLEKTSDKTEKAYLLNHFLEEFRGTVFRQTMFAEFEKTTQQLIEKGEALNSDELCKIYRKLNEQYFGPEMIIDPQIELEWSRIPHFYRTFYVYKYATGFSSAASLCSQILKEGEKAVTRYQEFLQSGSSDYPLELLKKAGVDLSTAKPIEDGMAMFESILDQFEALL